MLIKIVLQFPYTILIMTTSFSFTSLENIRKRLLDITNKNPLISYRFPEKNSLAILNIAADQLYAQLTRYQKCQITCIPQPKTEQLHEYAIKKGLDNEIIKQPSAKEWAKYLGINIDEQLSLVSPEKSPLQTYFYPNELELLLDKIRKQAASAIEETGSNILYLALGFLAWKDGETTHYAPLFTLPIKLNKQNEFGVNVYSIVLRDEDTH